MNDTVKIREYASFHHNNTNHLYDGKPYIYHLLMVRKYALKYAHLLHGENTKDIILSAFTHDLIEDCRLTYNDIKKECGETIAEITYAVSNEKGKTRKERANAKYYQGIRSVYGATFIKLCDRLANAEYSKQTKSKMFECYQKEQDIFYLELYSDEYKEMFNELDEILQMKKSK